MKISDIESQGDYDEKLYEYQVFSQASFEVKEEAILNLKRTYPQFDRAELVTSDEVLKDISDGEADISDMGRIN